MARPSHRKSSGGEWTSRGLAWPLLVAGTVIVAAGALVAGVVLGLGGNGSGRRTEERGAAATGVSAAAAHTTTTTVPLTVVSVTPAPAKTLALGSYIRIQFSQPLEPNSPEPTLAPAVAGRWIESGSTLTFHPAGGYPPFSVVTVIVPPSVTASEGGRDVALASAYHATYHVAGGSELRLQQLLAELKYLPLTFRPAAPSLSASDAVFTSPASPATASTSTSPPTTSPPTTSPPTTSSPVTSSPATSSPTTASPGGGGDKPPAGTSATTVATTTPATHGPTTTAPATTVPTSPPVAAPTTPPPATVQPTTTVPPTTTTTIAPPTTSTTAPAPGSALDREPTQADAVGTAPVVGTFAWAYPDIPSSLAALWTPAAPNLMTRGAVMAFEAENGLAVDGVAGPTVWTDLLRDVAGRIVDPDPYNYLEVNETGTEYLRVWSNGRVVYTTLANTGVPGAATQTGTFPVYLRYQTTFMKGTDVDGTKYDVQVYWVSYFNGSDAVHGYPRASYGFPQSNGCVELPIPNAQYLWQSPKGYDQYGVLVNVSA